MAQPAVSGLQQLHVVFAHDLGRGVGGPIVDHDDLEVGVLEARQTLQAVANRARAVVRRYDHRDARPIRAREGRLARPRGRAVHERAGGTARETRAQLPVDHVRLRVASLVRSVQAEVGQEQRSSAMTCRRARSASRSARSADALKLMRSRNGRRRYSVVRADHAADGGSEASELAVAYCAGAAAVAPSDRRDVAWSTHIGRTRSAAACRTPECTDPSKAILCSRTIAQSRSASACSRVKPCAWASIPEISSRGAAAKSASKAAMASRAHEPAHLVTAPARLNRVARSEPTGTHRPESSSAKFRAVHCRASVTTTWALVRIASNSSGLMKSKSDAKAVPPTTTLAQRPPPFPRLAERPQARCSPPRALRGKDGATLPSFPTATPQPAARARALWRQAPMDAQPRRTRGRLRGPPNAAATSSTRTVP